MVLRRFLMLTVIVSLVFSASLSIAQGFPENQNDPVLHKIIEFGQNDNQTMTWLDYMTNRFGVRITGSDAYNNAAEWAVYQFRKWGVQAELQEVGEMPVGFTRGPAYGKIVTPEEKYLFLTTPAFSAGTKGIQRGPVVIAPEDSMAIVTMKNQYKDAWVLVNIPGDLDRTARRRFTAFLTKTLEEGGALGMIRGAALPHRVSTNRISSWDNLPTLPDITLQDTHYDEIKEMVERGQDVELEFEICNWFKMGPVKYHNIIAWLPGTEYPDESIILSGHFDTVAGSKGGVDCGNGCTPAMEALRIIAKAGAKPKRTIMVHLFAAEEIGIVGSQAWLRQHPSSIPKIATNINRDGSPGAVIGASVPQSWYEDFEKITRPLLNLNSEFPFKLSSNNYPGAPATRPSGTDASAFSMKSVPTLRLSQESDHVYRSTYHTIWDTYDDVVPYSRHQEHTALALAVMAYGIANLDHLLSRDGVYLEEGLYADINTDQGRIIAELDMKNTPETVASFLSLFNVPGEQRGRQRGGQGGEEPPPIGEITNMDKNAAAQAEIKDKKYTAMAVSELPKEKNMLIHHDQSGVLGMMSPTKFYITTDEKSDYENKYTAIGKVIAGMDVLKTLSKGNMIKSVRITRVGDIANMFGRR
ncbi:M28 family peptidase [candidate division KSB1 bacterium]